MKNRYDVGALEHLVTRVLEQYNAVHGHDPDILVLSEANISLTSRDYNDVSPEHFLCPTAMNGAGFVNHGVSGPAIGLSKYARGAAVLFNTRTVEMVPTTSSIRVTDFIETAYALPVVAVRSITSVDSSPFYVVGTYLRQSSSAYPHLISLMDWERMVDGMNAMVAAQGTCYPIVFAGDFNFSGELYPSVEMRMNLLRYKFVGTEDLLVRLDDTMDTALSWFKGMDNVVFTNSTGMKLWDNIQVPRKYNPTFMNRCVFGGGSEWNTDHRAVAALVRMEPSGEHNHEPRHDEGDRKEGDVHHEPVLAGEAQKNVKVLATFFASSGGVEAFIPVEIRLNKKSFAGMTTKEDFDGYCSGYDEANVRFSMIQLEHPFDDANEKMRDIGTVSYDTTIMRVEQSFDELVTALFGTAEGLREFNFIELIRSGVIRTIGGHKITIDRAGKMNRQYFAKSLAALVTQNYAECPTCPFRSRMLEDVVRHGSRSMLTGRQVTKPGKPGQISLEQDITKALEKLCLGERDVQVPFIPGAAALERMKHDADVVPKYLRVPDVPVEAEAVEIEMPAPPVIEEKDGCGKCCVIM